LHGDISGTPVDQSSSVALLENRLIAMDAIRVGLQILLAMSMLTTELWALGSAATPVAIANLNSPGSREIR